MKRGPKDTSERRAKRRAMVLHYRNGMTLQEVGDEFGVTREWVRQVLVREGVTERYITPEGHTPMRELSRKCGRGFLRKRMNQALKQMGLTDQVDERTRFIRTDLAELVISKLVRFCSKCSKRVTMSNRFGICSGCMTSSLRISLDPQYRAAHNEANYRWRKNNPKAWNQITYRANKKYRDKRRARLQAST